MIAFGQPRILPDRQDNASETSVRIDYLIGVSVVFLLSREVFSGAFRYYFDVYSFSSAWFLFDAFFFSLVFLKFSRWIFVYKSIPILALIVAYLILAQSVIGYAKYGNIPAIVSGVKALMSLFLLAAGVNKFWESRTWRYSLFALLIISAAGVYLNQVTQFAWTGYSFSQLGVERVASREWWTGGERRLAGFGNGNGSTALTILALAIFLLVHTENRLVKAFIYATALASIFLTTSRTPFYTLILVLFLDFWPRRLFMGLTPVKPFVILVAAVGVLAPLLLGIPNLEALGQSISSMNSTEMRMALTWPGVIEMISRDGLLQAFFGHGFGSIGSPAIYTGQYISPISAVDNYFLYLFFLFGASGVMFYCLLIFAYLRLPSSLAVYTLAALVHGIFMANEGLALSFLTIILAAIGLRTVRKAS